MKAIGYQTAGNISRPEALQDITLPRPSATGQDLLVKVRAVSVNHVDTKVRQNATPEAGQWKVLGWDAVGEVVETGPDAAGFAPGGSGLLCRGGHPHRGKCRISSGGRTPCGPKTRQPDRR